MTIIKDFTLDFMLRIDFEALANPELDDLDASELEHRRIKNQKNYSFSKLYSRSNFNYIRLNLVKNDLENYIDYCLALSEKNIFSCCQLEQAIGVFKNDELKAFLWTDVGSCYHNGAHFGVVDYMINNRKSDVRDASTFYGEIEKNTIRLLYSDYSSNIDIDAADNHILLFNLTEFTEKLVMLKTAVNNSFDRIKSRLKQSYMNENDKVIIDEAFSPIK